jgi:RNA polymerase sigma-70 factor (ECF subfamily)
MPDAGEFFDRYHLAVYRYFLHLLGRADVAEDLTQEVFVRIVRGAERYSNRGREEAWVFTIVRAVYAEHARSAEHAPPLVSLDEATNPSSGGPRVVALGVMEALRCLSRGDQALLVLRELVGLTYEELAQTYGIPVGTVRTRMCRAREAFRRSLPDRIARAGVKRRSTNHDSQ